MYVLACELNIHDVMSLDFISFYNSQKKYSKKPKRERKKGEKNKTTQKKEKGRKITKERKM